MRSKRCLIVLSFLVCSFASKAQTITTIAGNHAAGYIGNGGPATAAELSGPNQVITDKAGNLYIADTYNSVVRKVDTAGVITTIAGTHTAGYSGDGGAATAAKFSAPCDVAISKEGNMYICDITTSTVRMINTSGIVSTVAGTGVAGYTGNGGPATAALLDAPIALYIDTADNLYVVEANNNCVRKIDAAGTISLFAGDTAVGYSGDGGPATAALFYGAIDVTGDKYGNIYIVDEGNGALRKVDIAGTITTIAGTGVLGYSGDGGPATSAELKIPYAVCVDTMNNIYITDNANERIRKIDTSGIITTVVGTGVNGYTGDGGAATAAEIYNTGGITFDLHGNMYVADFGNNVVRKVNFGDHALAVNVISNTITNTSIYPNPNNGNCSVQLSSSKDQQVNVGVYSLSGSLLMAADHHLSTGDNTISLNAENLHLSTGDYMMVIREHDGATSVKKFTIITDKN